MRRVCGTDAVSGTNDNVLVDVRADDSVLASPSGRLSLLLPFFSSISCYFSNSHLILSPLDAASKNSACFLLVSFNTFEIFINGKLKT